MFHKHKWRVFAWDQIAVYYWTVDRGRTPDRYDTQFTLLCANCGKMKIKRLTSYKLDIEQATIYAEAKGWDHSHLTG